MNFGANPFRFLLDVSWLWISCCISKLLPLADLFRTRFPHKYQGSASYLWKSAKPKSSDSNYENWPKQLVLFDCCSSNYWSTCRKQDWRLTIQAFQTTRPLTRFFIFWSEWGYLAFLVRLCIHSKFTSRCLARAVFGEKCYRVLFDFLIDDQSWSLFLVRWSQCHSGTQWNWCYSLL